MTMAAFAVVVVREREVEDGDQIAALAGYGRERPLLGTVMTISMLSLAGFPPLAGFVGKFLLFGAAIDQDMPGWPSWARWAASSAWATTCACSSVLWLGSPDPGRSTKILRLPAAVGAVAIASAVLTVGLAIGASPVLDVCRGAAESLLAP